MKESVKITIEKVIHFWKISRIPTKTEIHSREKLERLFKTWKNLQKSASRKSDRQTENEMNFCKDIDKLFDIAHADAMNLIKEKEDREFLINQREGRVGYIGNIDRKTEKRVANSFERKEASERNAERKINAMLVDMRSKCQLVGQIIRN